MKKINFKSKRKLASALIQSSKILVFFQYLQAKLQRFRNWNNRHSRHVLLCFYSAIFKLTSAKFQTFAFNLRTVWSSYKKFWQQFEINELYVLHQILKQQIAWLWFYDPTTAPKVWRNKRSHLKTAQVRQKIFHMVILLKIPLHPYQPTFGRVENFFFFLNLVRSSSPKAPNIEI